MTLFCGLKIIFYYRSQRSKVCRCRYLYKNKPKANDSVRSNARFIIIQFWTSGDNDDPVFAINIQDNDKRQDNTLPSA